MSYLACWSTAWSTVCSLSGQDAASISTRRQNATANLVDPEQPPVLLAVDPAFGERLFVQAVLFVLHRNLQEPETNVLSEGVSSYSDASRLAEILRDFMVKLQHACFEFVGVSFGPCDLRK